MTQQSWDYIAKIVNVGDSGCGKSSLTIRLCEGRFVNSHDVTIGVEFGSRIVAVGPPASDSLKVNDPTSGTHTPTGADSVSSAVSSPSSKGARDKPPKQKHMKLSLWDTAGQETYKSITRSYFRGASGALLVFDITRRATFAAVTTWLHDLRQIAEEGIVVVLVGNKSDLAPSSMVRSGEAESENKREVTRQEAEEWCRQHGVLRYVETSAKSGEGVERAFLEVAERIFQNIEAGRYDLNDRRSGVKSAGAGALGTNMTKAVQLTEVSGSKSSGGGCCG